MPVGDNVSELTDWVEVRVARDQSGLQLLRLDRLLKAEGTELADEELEGDEDAERAPGGDPEAEELKFGEESAAAAEVDVRIELIRSEINERKSAGANVYPFAVDEDRVSLRNVCGKDVYLLLLVLGTAGLPYRRNRRANEVEEAYDLVALAALKRFLGRTSLAVRFARTARSEELAETEANDPLRRPTSFPEAIKWLRHWLDVGPGPRPPDDSDPDTQDHWEDGEVEGAEPLGREPLTSYNDAGVDVVAWWRFADGRAGFPVVLAQCTVQLNWEKKVDDIKVKLWEKWIDFDTVPPQTALVIPFADRRDSSLWKDRTVQAGVILDRVRLIELLDELECQQLEDMVDDRVRTWTSNELAAA